MTGCDPCNFTTERTTEKRSISLELEQQNSAVYMYFFSFADSSQEEQS